jgi:tetratricopeptide (TPR) repeat protein
MAKCWYDLSVTFGNTRAQQEESVAALDRARELREKVVQACPEHRAHRHDLALTLGNLATAAWNLDRRDEALTVMERAVREGQVLIPNAPPISFYRRSLGRNLGKLAGWQWHTGRHDAALANVEKRAELWPGDAAGLYEAARELGLFILNSKETGGATAEAQKRSADLAVELLHRAVSAGYRDAHAIAEDRAFATLRNRTDFAALLEGMR